MTTGIYLKCKEKGIINKIQQNKTLHLLHKKQITANPLLCHRIRYTLAWEWEEMFFTVYAPRKNFSLATTH